LHHAAVLRSAHATQCLLDAGSTAEKGGSEVRMTVLHEAVKARSAAVVTHFVNAKDEVRYFINQLTN
jgi:hypothetical protein